MSSWYLQVEQLNLLSDSNKLLREQKNKLEQQLEASTSHAHELEVEVQPLKENIKLLTVQKDALVAEKTALKNEVLKYSLCSVCKHFCTCACTFHLCSRELETFKIQWNYCRPVINAHHLI